MGDVLTDEMERELRLQAEGSYEGMRTWGGRLAADRAGLRARIAALEAREERVDLLLPRITAMLSALADRAHLQADDAPLGPRWLALLQDIAAYEMEPTDD